VLSHGFQVVPVGLELWTITQIGSTSRIEPGKRVVLPNVLIDLSSLQARRMSVAWWAT
jgi:hypothetical protein